MRREPVWIDRRALLFLHEESAAQFGGARGLRNEGLLDSALARPVHRYLYDEIDDLAVLAAAYGFALAKNHPFVDGNKRVAFLALGLFLALNGQRLAAEQSDAVRTMLALAAGELDESGLVEWVRAHLRAR